MGIHTVWKPPKLQELANVLLAFCISALVLPFKTEVEVERPFLKACGLSTQKFPLSLPLSCSSSLGLGYFLHCRWNRLFFIARPSSFWWLCFLILSIHFFWGGINSIPERDTCTVYKATPKGYASHSTDILRRRQKATGGGIFHNRKGRGRSHLTWWHWVNCLLDKLNLM